jgi:hypothetical protein
VRLTDIKITGYISQKRDVTTNNLNNSSPGALRVTSSETFSVRETKKHFPGEVGG